MSAQSFKELLGITRLSLKQFSDRYNIPYRTCQNWIADVSTPPPYVLELLEYRIKTEKKMEDNKMKIIASIRENDSTEGTLIYFKMDTDTFKLSSSNEEEVTGGNIPSSEKEACNVVFQQWGSWQTFKWIDANNQPPTGMIKKFEIVKNSIEIKGTNRELIAEGCTQNQNDAMPEIIESFTTPEAALEALKSFRTDIHEFSGGSLYVVTEFCVEENVYDEDGEWIAGGNIYEWTIPGIEVIELPSNDTIGTFNNMKDAVSCLDELDEGFLSFN